MVRTSGLTFEIEGGRSNHTGWQSNEVVPDKEKEIIQAPHIQAVAPVMLLTAWHSPGPLAT